ncbi:glycosyltransferase family 4 protein [Paraburkholderia lacunae]|uniref:Glycosyltransferase subfamily 4-like N-terminal domain-containing protein n=1 Tax=Paraburkholderia lacunae TaxID=2211104 RepID=A0A370N1L0_9BURK|nr:glycosyltransferase family 4 protein [Paraburkholderia lacunae]RDJ99492.1 hypothetical protein DLM46_27835 [Paraburkholderia lacunae]
MKILIVCEHFFPQTGAQALQATKVADALHLAGCEVRVLCGVAQEASSDRPYDVQWVPPRDYGKATSSMGRALRRLRYEIDTVNTRGGWVRGMAAKVIEINRSFEADVIMTQSTPFRAHLVGLHLPPGLRKRWACYFSDLWPLSLTPRPYRTRLSDLLRPIQMKLLTQVMSTACRSIFTNDVSVLRLLQAWPQGDRARCHVVAHIGTPPSAGEPPSAIRAHYKKRFVHVGKLTRERSCMALIEAVTRLCNDSEAGELSFPGLSFVGGVDPAFRRNCDELVKKGVVEFVGDVDPAAARAICQAAGTLVVIEADMDESPFLASKFADYAMLDKPILAISPRGPIRDFLECDGGGVAVGHDADEIYAAMRSIIVQGDVCGGSRALAAHFDAMRIAGHYLDIFRLVK